MVKNENISCFPLKSLNSIDDTESILYINSARQRQNSVADQRNSDAYQRNGQPQPPQEGFPNAELLLKLLINTLHQMWNRLKILTNGVLLDSGAYKAFDKLVQLSARYPLIALGLIIGALTIVLPIAVITAFAVCTIVMTFTGFVLLEGSLLTIVFVLLFGCLGALLIVFLFFGIVILAGYFGFAHIYDLYRGNKTALRNFLLQERAQTEGRDRAADGSSNGINGRN